MERPQGVPSKEQARDSVCPLWGYGPAEGYTFTLAEYSQWLTKAGFAHVQTADIGSHLPMIVASKRKGDSSRNRRND